MLPIPPFVRRGERGALEGAAASAPRWALVPDFSAVGAAIPQPSPAGWVNRFHVPEPRRGAIAPRLCRRVRAAKVRLRDEGFRLKAVHQTGTRHAQTVYLSRYGWAIVVAPDHGKIRVQFSLATRNQAGDSILGAEDQMQQNPGP